MSPRPSSAIAALARGTLLILCLLAAPDRPAEADAGPPPPAPAAAFDATLAGSVFGAALAFMSPRILEPVGVPELTGWGLGGITALDPSLTATVDGPTLKLVSPAGTLFQTASPASDDAFAWGRAAASLCLAAWTSSADLRGAGAGGVVQSFFDELFNHLDPYSRYIGPQPAAADHEKLVGSAGVGIALAAGRHGLVIASMSPDGPLSQIPGLMPGDAVLAVGGHDIGHLSVDDATALLGGEPGTDVTIRVRTRRELLDIRVTREILPPPSVFSSRLGRLLVLKVTGFSHDTAEEMSTLLDQGLREGGLRDHPTGVILDLRGNRGGLLQQAVTAAALVLDNGVAVTTEGRFPAANHIWSVQGGDITHGLPLVVLVDGRTASAAEILAAALADHGRAVVAGSSTLGKGLVQTKLALADGGELFVTWSRVLAPLGWPIQGLGVLPQLCTSQGAVEVASQLHELATGSSPLAPALAAERRARAPMPVDRVLEIREACPAAIGTDGDVDAARSLLADPVAYQAALDSVPKLDE